MEKNSISKNNLLQKINSFLTYGIALALIIDCRSIWMSDPQLHLDNLNYIFLVFCSVGSLILLFQKNPNQDIGQLTIKILFIVIYFLFYLFLTKININLGIKLIIITCLFLWILFLDTSSSIPSIFLAYKNLIIIIAFISLFFWLFGSFLGIIHPTNYVPTAWGNKYGNAIYIPSYFNLYVQPQQVSLPVIGEIGRNSAIFTEGPMASLNFCMALLIELCDDQSKFKKRNYIILILSILSTFSTTGYILLIFILYYKILFNSSNKILKIIFTIPVLVLAIVAVVYLFSQKMEYGSESTTVRLDDYKAGVITWLQHPFLGSGLSNTNGIQQNMSAWRSYNTGFSNSIMEILAEGGIYLSLFYFYAFIKGLYSGVNKKNYNELLMVISMFYLFVTTIFTYQYILILFLIYFCNMNRSKDLINS